jgi:uncharacterized protein (DUF4415 family)
MPKLKQGHISPTPAEDAAITKAAVSDPDALPYTDAEWAKVKPTIGRGRPKLEHPKVSLSLRLDTEVVASFRATGPGWQTRINLALQRFLKEHSPVDV